MSSLGSSPRPKQYDPDSNVYVAGLPRNFNKDKLHQLFIEYGDILRYKFVSPKDDTKCPYGFVQFALPLEAQESIKALNGCSLPSGETIEVSIAAVGRRASPSEEPTNLYIENMPNSWNNEQLTKVFGRYGTIVQSKITGNNVAFVRFETHQQALNAINALHKTSMDSEGRTRLTVRFATCQHKKSSTNLNVPTSSSTTSSRLLTNSCIGPRSLNAAPFQPSSSSFTHNANDYSPRSSTSTATTTNNNNTLSLRSRHSGGFYNHHHGAHSNENNLYIKHLPKSYNQSILERFFEKFGPISSATIINDSVGVAFVRFKKAEDARRAIKELNGTKPPDFDKEIIVKLAHSDIDQQQQQQQQHQSINHALQHNLGGMDQLSLQQQVFNNYQMQQQQQQQAVAAAAAAQQHRHQHHQQHHQQPQPQPVVVPPPHHQHHQLALPNHPHFQWATNLPYNMYNSQTTQQTPTVPVAPSKPKHTLRVTAPFFNPSSNATTNSSNGYTTDNTHSAYSPHSPYDHTQNATILLPDIPTKSATVSSFHSKALSNKKSEKNSVISSDSKQKDVAPPKQANCVSLIKGFLRAQHQTYNKCIPQKAGDLLLANDTFSKLILSHFSMKCESAPITDDTFSKIMEGFSMSNAMANQLELSNDDIDDIVNEVDRALSQTSKSKTNSPRQSAVADNDGNDEFAELAVQVHALEDRFGAMQAKIDDLGSKLSGHKRDNEESRQFELSVLHTQFNQSVKTLYSRIDQHIVSIRDRIDRQHHSMTQRMSKMQQQINDLQIVPTTDTQPIFELDKNEQDIDAVEIEDGFDEELENVKRWLAQTVRVSNNYIDIFISNGYDDMESIRDITDNELIKIGITKIGHRKKILKYAAKIIDGDAAATNSAFHPFLLTALDNETALSAKSTTGTKSKFFLNDQQSNGSSADFGCFSTMEPTTNWMCHHTPSRSRNESPSNTYNTSETI